MSGRGSTERAHPFDTLAGMSSPTPEQLASRITPEQDARAQRLYGLPFVTIGPDKLRFICQLSNGEKVRAVELEEIFNGGLILEALEGEGAAGRTNLTGDDAQRLHAELLAQAEKAFGVTVRDALPIYLQMERTSYGRWDERPRVRWPRPVAN